MTFAYVDKTQNASAGLINALVYLLGIDVKKIVRGYAEPMLKNTSDVFYCLDTLSATPYSIERRYDYDASDPNNNRILIATTTTSTFALYIQVGDQNQDLNQIAVLTQTALESLQAREYLLQFGNMSVWNFNITNTSFQTAEQYVFEAQITFDVQYTSLIESAQDFMKPRLSISDVQT